MPEQKLNGTCQHFAVIGNPIEHSQSPMIHQSFAQQMGVELNYKKILATKENIDDVIGDFFNGGGRGLNITTPFKEDAARIATKCSEVVKRCNSANTLFIDSESNQLRAESTDGLGWRSDLAHCGINLENKNVLVIGAGGAARVLVDQLLSESVETIHVCNRTESKAEELQNNRVTISGLENIPSRQWHLIINTLSVGWHGDYPAINATVADGTAVYDLNYGKGADVFKSWFLRSGGERSLFHDGWGMLVEQAALSFNHWWGLKVDTSELIASGPPKN